MEEKDSKLNQETSNKNPFVHKDLRDQIASFQRQLDTITAKYEVSSAREKYLLGDIVQIQKLMDCLNVDDEGIISTFIKG